MKKIIIAICTVSIVLAISPGCSKKKGCTDPISINYNSDAEEDDGTCQYAGSGGNTTIVAKAKHHGMIIPNQPTYPDSAFVKFNVTESPGNNPGAYDQIIVGEDGEDHIHIPGLKPGKYYIMMTGFDTTINERVKGGIPLILTQTSGEKDLDVPVTE